jgi:hypothetical protein
VHFPVRAACLERAAARRLRRHEYSAAAYPARRGSSRGSASMPAASAAHVVVPVVPVVPCTCRTVVPVDPRTSQNRHFVYVIASV